MIVDMKQMVIELDQRGIASVEAARGARIDCLCGRIWITEHRSPGDIVLEAGESYELSRGVAVVQALREAHVALRATTISPSRAELAGRVQQLWSRWVWATERQPALSARTS
jgi:hypothetical protein